MKTLAALLFAPTLALVAALAWFFASYSVIAASNGDEWLVVTNERAAACKQPGGCTVLTVQEFRQLVMGLMQRQQGGAPL